MGDAVVFIGGRMWKQNDGFASPFVGNDVVEGGGEGEVDVCYCEGGFHDDDVRVFGDARVPTLGDLESVALR